MTALDWLRAAGLPTASNINLNRLNHRDLEPLYDELRARGVSSWQVQLTAPLGRAADRPALLLQPWDLLDVVPRVAALKDHARAHGITLTPGNNLGYFGPEEQKLRSIAATDRDHWQGCQAGRFVMGLSTCRATHENLARALFRHSTHLTMTQEWRRSPERAIWPVGDRTSQFPGPCNGAGRLAGLKSGASKPAELVARNGEPSGMVSRRRPRRRCRTATLAVEIDPWTGGRLDSCLQLSRPMRATYMTLCALGVANGAAWAQPTSTGVTERRSPSLATVTARVVGVAPEGEIARVGEVALARVPASGVPA
jgi:hypothetical protein